MSSETSKLGFVCFVLFCVSAMPGACGSSPARDQTHRDDPSHCSDNAGSLTCCAPREHLSVMTPNRLCRALTLPFLLWVHLAVMEAVLLVPV